MNESGDPGRATAHLPVNGDCLSDDCSLDERTRFERIVPRLSRNMLLLSVLPLAPVIWFYRGAGAIGFAFGVAISCANFRALARGVEALTDRVVNRNSREKGGRIVLLFLLRYGLVAAAAYAIFKSSAMAFRGLLWGLCMPVAALMAEAAWQAYLFLRGR